MKQNAHFAVPARLASGNVSLSHTSRTGPPLPVPSVRYTRTIAAAAAVLRHESIITDHRLVGYSVCRPGTRSPNPMRQKGVGPPMRRQASTVRPASRLLFKLSVSGDVDYQDCRYVIV